MALFLMQGAGKKGPVQQFRKEALFSNTLLLRYRTIRTREEESFTEIRAATLGEMETPLWYGRILFELCC